MTALPEDVIRALQDQPGLVRQYALEQALGYAMEASQAVSSRPEQGGPARHQVMSLAQVSSAWSHLAEALGVRP